MSVLAGLTGSLAILGLLVALYGLLGRDDAMPHDTRRRVRETLLPMRDGAANRSRQRHAGQLIAALAVGGLVWLLTGWPVAALAGAIAAPGLPWLVRSQTGAARIDRLEALEQWTRRLADLLVVGSGIEQALVASVRTAPAPIAAEVGALAARLRARIATEQALRSFADDLDDPAADLVAAALILAARRRGRGLAQVLDGLARAVADEVVVRRGIEADRAKPRTTARAVTWISLVAASALMLVDRAYVAPFGTAVGQLVLAMVFVLFAGAFAWMHSLARVNTGRRFLPAADGAPTFGPAGAVPADAGSHP